MSAAVPAALPRLLSSNCVCICATASVPEACGDSENVSVIPGQQTSEQGISCSTAVTAATAMQQPRQSQQPLVKVYREQQNHRMVKSMCVFSTYNNVYISALLMADFIAAAQQQLTGLPVKLFIPVHPPGWSPESYILAQRSAAPGTQQQPGGTFLDGTRIDPVSATGRGQTATVGACTLSSTKASSASTTRATEWCWKRG